MLLIQKRKHLFAQIDKGWSFAADYMQSREQFWCLGLVVNNKKNFLFIETPKSTCLSLYRLTTIIESLNFCAKSTAVLVKRWSAQNSSYNRH